MLRRSPAKVGLPRARLWTGDHITPGDLVCPTKSIPSFHRQERRELPPTRGLGGSLAAAAGFGGFRRAPTARAAPSRGRSQNGHFPPPVHRLLVCGDASGAGAPAAHSRARNNTPASPTPRVKPAPRGRRGACRTGDVGGTDERRVGRRTACPGSRFCCRGDFTLPGASAASPLSVGPTGGRSVYGRQRLIHGLRGAP